ncbi:MAG: hypothetical protein R3F46_13965 [bacterium]
MAEMVQVIGEVLGAWVLSILLQAQKQERPSHKHGVARPIRFRKSQLSPLLQPAICVYTPPMPSDRDYSHRTLPQKLGIKPGMRLLIANELT